MQHEEMQPQSHVHAQQINMARSRRATKLEEPKVFTCAIPHAKYIFSNGKTAAFLGGEYVTDNSYEVDELMAEVNSDHPHIRVGERKVSKKDLLPIEALREQIIKEYLEKQAAALKKDNDAGTSDQSGKLQGIANSHTISEAAAGSDSVGDARPAAPLVQVGKK